MRKTVAKFWGRKVAPKFKIKIAGLDKKVLFGQSRSKES